MKMWLIVFTILSYICFGLMLDVSTQSLGKKELKDADLLKNIKLELDILKWNCHSLLIRVQKNGDKIDILQKQNQDLKQKLDNTVNKTDALINKDDSFVQNIGVLQDVTLQHQSQLNKLKSRIRKSRISVGSSMTIFKNSLQEIMIHHSNAKEEMKIFKKKIKDENNKVIVKIESAMDSFMKNVSINNTLVTDKLQKKSEDVVELTTRVTHQESDKLQSQLLSMSTKLEKTVAAVEELKANVTETLLPHLTSMYFKLENTVSDVKELKANESAVKSFMKQWNNSFINSKLKLMTEDATEIKTKDIAMKSFMKHVSSNNTLVTSKLKQMTEEATETKSKVTHQESSIYKLWSHIIPMSSKLEKIVLDVAELKTDDTHTMCYNGGVWQKYDESYICVCATGFLGKQCEYSDGKETSFLVVFHKGLGSPSPMILVASANTANLSIRYFNNNANQTITIDKCKTEHNLRKSVLPSDGIHLSGVEVHSDVRINLHGFVYGWGVSEGFLSLPLRFASTKYIIPSLPAYTVTSGGFTNVLVISPINQNTTVSIHLKLKRCAITYENKKYNNNDIIKLVINKYSTLQLSHTSDLSGTMVTSSKPVIVVSGNNCNTAVPAVIRLGSCNPFIESVLPTDQLDNMFITPYISTRLNNTVRIQAVNSTNLSIKTGNKTISKTINARDFFDFYYNTISLISSSDDILVMSYPHGLNGGKGDPFMMTIPGVNQYLYTYDFVVPTGFDSFISITVQSDATDGLFLDGNSSKSQSSVFSISEGINNLSTFSLPISAGFHRIEHKQKVRFGLWIYGNVVSRDGYGYPAGMAYKAFN